MRAHSGRPADHLGVIGRLEQIHASYKEWRRARRRGWKSHRRLMRAVRFYRQFIKPGMVCFDVGANVGNRTEAFLRLGARVVAVEPQPSCARILVEKFGKNPNFTLIQRALGRCCGENEMFLSSAHTLSSMSREWIENVQRLRLFPDCSWDNKITVETTTLDSLIECYGSPDLLKIDVEGFEYDVLLGLSSPVHVISLEYTLGALQPLIESVHHLESLGPISFDYSEGETMKLAMRQWVAGERIVDILSASRGCPSGDIYGRFEQSS